MHSDMTVSKQRVESARRFNPSAAWLALTCKSPDMQRGSRGSDAMTQADAAGTLAGLHPAIAFVGRIARTGELYGINVVHDYLYQRVAEMSYRERWKVAETDQPRRQTGVLRNLVAVALLEFTRPNQCVSCNGKKGAYFTEAEARDKNLIDNDSFEWTDDFGGVLACAPCHGTGMSRKPTAKWYARQMGPGYTREVWSTFWARRYERVYQILQECESEAAKHVAFHCAEDEDQDVEAA